MLLIYIVKSDKSLVGDKEKKYTLKGKDTLPFKIWIFRNSQRDRDADLFFCSDDFTLGAR